MQEDLNLYLTQCALGLQESPLRTRPNINVTLTEVVGARVRVIETDGKEKTVLIRSGALSVRL